MIIGTSAGYGSPSKAVLSEQNDSEENKMVMSQVIVDDKNSEIMTPPSRKKKEIS